MQVDPVGPLTSFELSLEGCELETAAVRKLRARPALRPIGVGRDARTGRSFRTTTRRRLAAPGRRKAAA